MPTPTRKTTRISRLIDVLEPRTLLSSYSFNTLTSFAITGPYDPSGTIVRDSAGNLFGIANAIGTNDNGGIYELPKGSSTPTVVATFTQTGAFAPTPVGLLIDSNDNIFGVTELSGDKTDDGTVFELAHGASSITTLASFSQATTGHSPQGNIVADSSGNIYGVTDSGGSNGGGTIWKFTPATNTLTALGSFPLGPSIEGPQGPFGIAVDATGNLFATTAGQSLFGDYGAVWELPAGSATLQKLATFNGTDGTAPGGSLIVDSSGNLFGETQFGGANNNGNTPAGLGTIYEVASGSGTITDLASFNGTDGEYPVGGLKTDSAGDLFGIASKGGNTAGNSEGSGNVYELAKGSSTITPLVSFHGTDGKLPEGSMLLDSSGNIFATASAGGSKGAGIVFELTPGGGQTGGGGVSATLTPKAPTTIIAGQKIKAAFATTIINGNATTLSEAVTGALYLSADGAVDSSSIRVGTTLAKKLKIKANGHTTIASAISTIPAITPAGTYQWIEQLTQPDGSTFAASSATSVTVVAPDINLTGSFLKFKSTAKIGHKFSETITISNLTGNITAAGTLPIVIETSPDGLTADATVLTTINKKISIKPGKFANIGITLTAPASAQAFYLIVKLDPQHTLTSVSETTNTLISASPIVAS